MKAVETVPGPNYTAARATFDIARDGQSVALMQPEKRQYRMPPRPTTTAAIRSGIAGDLYVVIGDEDIKGGFVTRLYYKPCVLWLWAGGALLVLGGLISLADRRHRIGAPARARVAGVGAKA